MPHFVPDVTLTSCSICTSGCAEEEIAKRTRITIMLRTNLCTGGSFPPAEPRIRSDGCLPRGPSIIRWILCRLQAIAWSFEMFFFCSFSLLVPACRGYLSSITWARLWPQIRKSSVRECICPFTYLLNKNAPRVYSMPDSLLFTENRNRKKN